jgi:hypothetical protein
MSERKFFIEKKIGKTGNQVGGLQKIGQIKTEKFQLSIVMYVFIRVTNLIFQKCEKSFRVC